MCMCVLGGGAYSEEQDRRCAVKEATPLLQRLSHILRFELESIQEENDPGRTKQKKTGCKHEHPCARDTRHVTWRLTEPMGARGRSVQVQPAQASCVRERK